MGLTLLGQARWSSDRAAPPALRHASPAGRRLHALALELAPLAARDHTTGVYQPLGAEKTDVFDELFAIIEKDGFDGIKPASAITQHQPFGPLCSVAIALGLAGPFFTLEAGATAGVHALVQAATDLARGRVDQALLGAYAAPDRASLVLCGWLPKGGVHHKVWFGPTAGAPPAEALTELEEALGARLALRSIGPDDLHGLETLAEALRDAAAGQPQAVWAAPPAGQAGGAALLGFSRGA